MIFDSVIRLIPVASAISAIEMRLFARKVRIDYAKHGDPLHALVWEAGAGSGYVIKADPAGPKGIRVARALMRDLLDFEARGQVGQRELEKYFVG
jgi:5-methylcytosine-specific restriction protein A